MLHVLLPILAQQQAAVGTSTRPSWQVTASLSFKWSRCLDFRLLIYILFVRLLLSPTFSVNRSRGVLSVRLAHATAM